MFSKYVIGSNYIECSYIDVAWFYYLFIYGIYILPFVGPTSIVKSEI